MRHPVAGLHEDRPDALDIIQVHRRIGQMSGQYVGDAVRHLGKLVDRRAFDIFKNRLLVGCGSGHEADSARLELDDDKVHTGVEHEVGPHPDGPCRLGIRPHREYAVLRRTGSVQRRARDPFDVLLAEAPMNVRNRPRAPIANEE